MRVIPYFDTTVGTEVFRKNIEGDYQEKTINFLRKCKKNDGSDAYPMKIVEPPKKIKHTKIKEVVPDATETEKFSV